MKVTSKALLAASLLLAPAAFATKIPIPIEGATLNVSVQVQTQFLINENGAPNGTDPSYDIFVRRTRFISLWRDASASRSPPSIKTWRFAQRPSG